MLSFGLPNDLEMHLVNIGIDCGILFENPGTCKQLRQGPQAIIANNDLGNMPGYIPKYCKPVT